MVSRRRKPFLVRSITANDLEQHPSLAIVDEPMAQLHGCGRLVEHTMAGNCPQVRGQRPRRTPRGGPIETRNEFLKCRALSGRRQ
jgi:hypothetical protein